MGQGALLRSRKGKKRKLEELEELQLKIEEEQVIEEIPR